MKPINEIKGYRSWLAMKDRCYNPNSKKYADYGGRGITICDEWKNDFRKFIEDMGPRPYRHSIDRKDNDGNYEPTNCRWATPKEQANNRSSNRLLTLDGITLNIEQWSKKLNLKRVTINYRLGKGLPIEEVLSTTINKAGYTGKEVIAYHVESRTLVFDSTVKTLTTNIGLPYHYVNQRLREGKHKPYKGYVIVYHDTNGKEILDKYVIDNPK